MYSGNRKPLAGSTSFTVRLVGGINSPDRKSSGRAHAAEGRAHSGRGGESGSKLWTRAVGGGAFGRSHAAEAPKRAWQRWAGPAWAGPGLHLKAEANTWE